LAGVAPSWPSPSRGRETEDLAGVAEGEGLGHVVAGIVDVVLDGSGWGVVEG
jgi:hypothetical protein